MKWPFGKKGVPYLAVIEYWVYVQGDKIPPQDLLTGRILRSSPFKVDGHPACGPPEGLLFSDIRLHMAMVLKAKNPHLFRPDLFDRHVEPTAAVLEALSNASALVKLRYLSAVKLADERHLRFLPHLAEAAAYFGKSEVIFDSISEKLIGIAEFREQLAERPDTANPDFHLRTIWVEEEEGGHVETRGLMKVGFPELRTHAAPSDHRVVILDVVAEAAAKLWKETTLPDQIDVEAFGDEFVVQLEPKSKGPIQVRVIRRHPV
ncbi:MAG: hypothetical protein KF784_06435 [Fimbriimonadaceae bacterium]|nr:hypothetical protein [Fimbriimonadaceae bacterium]